MKMTESIKEREIREELSSEAVDEVSGGSRMIKRNDWGRPYCPERRKPPVKETAPSPAPSSAPAAPGDEIEEETDNIENTNENGTQNIVNQGRDNKAGGKVRF